MKRIRSIQFKVFICLFISFMIVFGFIIKNRYTNYRNQLYYNDYSMESNEYIDYVKYLSENEFLSLDKAKELLDKMPKSIENVVCLLDDQEHIIKQYGLNEQDSFLYASTIREDQEIYQGSLDYYYIDTTGLSKKQIEFLKENIRSCQNVPDISLYFNGEIQELGNFKESTKYTQNAQDRYFYVKPSYISYNKDIMGVKKQNEVKKIDLNFFYHHGKIIYKNGDPYPYQTETLSVKKINQLTHQTIKSKFSDVYVNGMSESGDSGINLQQFRKSDAIKESIKNNYLMDANMAVINSTNSYKCYIIRVNRLDSSASALGYLVVFYDFSTTGIRNIYQWIVTDNIPLFAGGILFSLLFSLFISYITTRRIKQIDQAALEISNNHFDVVLNTKGHDELSSLSSHINTMSSNLKRNIDALNLEIDQVKKMEQLRKEFIAQFTHEIKTPLAIINGNIDLLENVEDLEKKDKYIEVINKEIAVINDLVLQMLDLSKLEAKAITLDKKEIDLRELSEDIIDDYEQLLMDKKLKIEIQGEDVLIVGDRKRIEMVIQNYLSNAIKHAFINSTIKIKIKENEFSIENKGKQIDENRMDSIWESFVSDDQKGTGLGLAIVRNILELHEMSYGVYNLQGGVEFYFRWKK